jgi:hypothetical protein
MLNFYKVMAVPMLMYGSECWAMNKADRRAVEAAEMKLLRYVARCTRKDNIRQKLNIFKLGDSIQQNKKN